MDRFNVRVRMVAGDRAVLRNTARAHVGRRGGSSVSAQSPVAPRFRRQRSSDADASPSPTLLNADAAAQVQKIALPEAGSEVLWSDTEQSPQEVWHAVEDLWLRLAQDLPVRVEADGQSSRVVVCGVDRPLSMPIAELHAIAQDPGRYAWHWEGRSGAFVRSIAIEGRDLVLTMTSIPTIGPWPQGDDLGWQVKGLLARWRTRQSDEGTEVRSQRGAPAASPPLDPSTARLPLPAPGGRRTPFG